MVICSRRTVAALRYKEVVSEEEWILARKALEYLDLADHNEKLSSFYQDDFHFNYEFDWIATSGKGFPVDDCRVHWDWFNDESHSPFHHLELKSRVTDWIGRNLFLEYVSQKLLPNPSYLESGDAALRYHALAQLCGFEEWKRTETDYPGRICDIVFWQIYPSVLIGLSHIRDQEALLDFNLWWSFSINSRTFSMLFEKLSDTRQLGILLDVAKRTGFDLWQVGEQVEGFTFLIVLLDYIVRKRYDMVMMVLDAGMKIREDPTYWLRSIYATLWSSEDDFAASREFTEMFQRLFEATGVNTPLDIVQFILTEEYEESMGRMDPAKGKKMLYELLDTCARFLSS